MALRRAARAVQAGDADVVACVAADANHVESFRQMLGGFSPLRARRELPVRIGRAELDLRVHHRRTTCAAYGATREDFGRIAVAQRANALGNPACALQEAADARAVPRRAADRRADPPVRLRHAVRRRRGVPGDERGARARPRPRPRARARRDRAPQRLRRRPGPAARRLARRPRRPLRAGRRRRPRRSTSSRPTTTIRSSSCCSSRTSASARRAKARRSFARAR